jgi:hypothetical protein
MKGLSVGGLHDALDPECSRMENEEAFEECISYNDMQQNKKSGRFREVLERI